MENKSNWLLFNESMKDEWCEETARLLEKVLEKDHVVVDLRLPTKEEAKTAFEYNIDLKGSVTISIDGKFLKIDLFLPYDGVFLRSRSDDKEVFTASMMVWHSWLGEKPGFRFVKTPSGDVYWRVGLPGGQFTGRKIEKIIHNEESQSEDGEAPGIEWLKIFGKNYLGWKDDSEWLSAKNWNGMHGIACRLYQQGKEVDAEDLEHRMLLTFPVWLRIRLCQRLWRWRDLWGKNQKRLKNLLERTLIPLSSLTRRNNQKVAAETGIVYIDPNNAVELCARLTHVSRYKRPHAQLERLSAKSRQNHDSFNGRLCPLESPESELVGLSLQLAGGATVNFDGSIDPAPDEGSGCLKKLGMGAALVPFAPYNDGVRMMMGAKNLRQVVPIQGREVPSIRTGGEERIEALTNNLVDIGICPCTHQGEGGDRHLALGRDLLVAYLPWKGWNIDDAVVIGKHVIERGWFTTTTTKCYRRRVKNKCRVVALAKEGTVLKSGSVIAELAIFNGITLLPIAPVVYKDPERATLKRIRCGIPQVDLLNPVPLDEWVRSYTLEYEIEKEIPLGVGDKLMGRHGNKGVVGRIEKNMPMLKDGKTPIDILLNPHGVISRMNLGQLLETHIGWLLKKDIKAEELVKDDAYSDKIGYPCQSLIDHCKVQDKLAEKELGRLGRMRLQLQQDDGNVEWTKEAVVVGYEHIVRLCHIPGLKAQARRGGKKEYYATKTGQAVHGRKVGGGQRLGEMEVWALDAYKVDHILEEMLGGKSDAAWAKDWATGDALQRGTPPIGEFWSGFPHLLRDWLFALLIDLKFDEKRKRLSFSLLADKTKMPTCPNADEVNKQKVESVGEQEKSIVNDETARQLAMDMLSDKMGPRIGEAVKKRIESGEGNHRLVKSDKVVSHTIRAQYHCKALDEGDTIFNKRFLVMRKKSEVLKVASFLEAFGLRIDGAIIPIGQTPSEGDYVDCGCVVVKRVEAEDGEDLNKPLKLHVSGCFSPTKGRKKDSDCVRLKLSPDETDRVDWWPEGFILCCERRYSIGKTRIPASTVWKKITADGGKPKRGDPRLADFNVTFEGEELKIIGESREELSDCNNNNVEESLWSSSIFGDIKRCFPRPDEEKWGYIELPFDMQYPLEAFIDGKFIALARKGARRTPEESDAYNSFVEKCPHLQEELESRTRRIRVIPVLPLHYRTSMVGDKMYDRLGTKGYAPILRACKDYTLAQKDEKGEEEKREKEKKVKDAVIYLFKLLIKEFDGKMGLLRREGLGRRVDRSARLVIAPDPDLEWNQTGVPAAVLWELMGDKVLAWANDESMQENLIEHFNAQETAKCMSGWSWNRSCHSKDDLAKIYKILKLYLQCHSDELVLLNRQPSLHRDSMRAFYPVPLPHEEGYALRISPLVCKGFGADFDGDEMVVHYPVSPKAQKDAKKLLPEANLLSMSDGSPMVSYSQDFRMGCYLNPRRTLEGSLKDLAADLHSAEATVEDNSDVRERKRINGVLANLNREEPLSDENLKNLLSGVCDDGKLVIKFIHKLMKDAFAECTRIGLSFGFYDFWALAEQIRPIREQKERDAKKRDDVDMDLGKEQCKEIYLAIKDSPSVADYAGGSIARMVCSEARGAKQIEQLVNRRGHLDGMDKGRAISTSIVEGMDWNQTFDAAKNARSSMCDKKLNTAKAGALTRRLVMALWPVEIADVACNATNGLWIEIKKDDSSSLKERLTGRFSIGDVREPQSGQLIVADGDEITASIANQIITLDIDKVHVRSILNCKCEHGICAKCYGALPSGELPPIGYPAGLIAAQSIGERGTQLSMQSFHGGDSITKRFAIFSRLFTDSVKQKTFEDFMKDIMAHDENNIYSKLEERHFIILYRALQGAGDKLDNVVSREKNGFLSWLVARLTDKGSRYQSAQMKRLLAGALGDCAPDKLISPVAKILFNFCGDRKMPCR